MGKVSEMMIKKEESAKHTIASPSKTDLITTPSEVSKNVIRLMSTRNKGEYICPDCLSKNTGKINCTSCGFNAGKPQQTMGAGFEGILKNKSVSSGDQKILADEEWPEEGLSLKSLHDGENDISDNGDGGVMFYGFQRNGEDIVLKVSIQQRGNPHEFTHVGRKKGPTGNWDGERTYVRKISSGKKINRDVRIYLIKGTDGYNFGPLHSGKERNGVLYDLRDGKYIPNKESFLPLDANSIRKIGTEAYRLLKDLGVV